MPIRAVNQSIRSIALPVVLFALIQAVASWYVNQPGNEDSAGWAVNVMYLCLIGSGYLSGYLTRTGAYFYGFLAGMLSAVSVILLFENLLEPAQSRVIFVFLGGVLALLGVLLGVFDRKNRSRT